MNEFTCQICFQPMTEEEFEFCDICGECLED